MQTPTQLPDTFPLGEMSQLFTDPGCKPEAGDVAALTERNLGNFSLDSEWDQAHRRLVATDLTYALNFLIFSDGPEQPGPNLLHAVDTVCTDLNRPPVLTYDDVVVSNPVKSPRTFTAGAVGASEAGFYEKHLEIEAALAPAVNSLEDVRRALSIGDLTCRGVDLEAAQTAVKSGMGTLVDNMRALLPSSPDRPDDPGLNKDHFDIFRRYFMTHPETGLPGPSGLFSPGIALLDLTVGKTNLAKGAYLDQLRGYLNLYPITERAGIAQILKSDRYRCLGSLARSANHTEAQGLVSTAVEGLEVFRRLHMKAATQHIPTDTGSAGTDFRHFLIERQRMAHVPDAEVMAID